LSSLGPWPPPVRPAGAPVSDSQFNYDPETDTFYQGIGNAGPDWDAEYRPGDNKWAASVLAINASDGMIKWGYQYTPNDPYDFDEISEHPIINANDDLAAAEAGERDQRAERHRDQWRFPARSPWSWSG
jgi:alcohol dehydrogenase (cytochrome c)